MEIRELIVEFKSKTAFTRNMNWNVKTCYAMVHFDLILTLCYLAYT